MKLIRGLLLVTLTGAVAACGSSSSYTPTDAGLIYSGGGPVDGTWKQTATTCDGTAQTGGGTVTVTINNATAHTVSVENGGCTQTQDGPVTYPSTSSFTFTPTSTNCSGSCGSGQCGSGSGADGGNGSLTFTYTVSGNTLTLTQTQVGSNGGCQAGQTIQYTFQKQ